MCQHKYINMNMNNAMPMASSSNSNLISGLATLGTTLLCKKLNLDMMQYGIVYGLMIAILQLSGDLSNSIIKL